MRVIAGCARRLLLKTVEGTDTRPTTDRIKETLFNMLSQKIFDCRFLDLFSGSGAIGIEALSRGAVFCAFVENSKAAVSCIEENLKTTGLREKAVLLNMDVIAGLKKLEQANEPFDIIFMDPPYNKELEKAVLTCLSESKLVDKHTLIIVEASKDTDVAYLPQFGFILKKAKVYKTNQHLFITKGD